MYYSAIGWTYSFKHKTRGNGFSFSFTPIFFSKVGVQEQDPRLLRCQTTLKAQTGIGAEAGR